MTTTSQKTGRTVAAVLAAAVFGLTGGIAGASPKAMQVTGPTSPPIGHYEFCANFPAECAERTASSAPLRLSRGVWDTIVSVNNTVNAAITPRTDMEMWGVPEVWSYPRSEGDCEDYVLLKRHMLREAGLPAGSLLITVVRQENGDGHAVLTVRTDHGDFILDNLEGRVLAWGDTGYTYLKRQSSQNSGQWVRVDDNREVIVGSVRK